MKARYQPEIRRAALAALRSGDTLISRQRIEDEIEDHPDGIPDSLAGAESDGDGSSPLP